MAFTPEFMDRVRQANDIVEVVRPWVALKRSGSSWKGLCPFHAERSPSFHVQPARQTFHCFGCGEGGDVFAFVQKREKLDFVEAVKQLAERAGLELPQAEAPEAAAESARRRDQERKLRRLLELAAVWFRRNLEEAAHGQAALAYARKRGLDDAARETFALGYAPADPGALLAAAGRQGFEPRELVECGLAAEGERGIYTRFRDRLMFPIRDPKGEVVGFGGRLLGPGEPKYLNSPDSPFFSKGRLLYPWSVAKGELGRLRQAVVCEGYMDAIALHQAGVGNAVATLGTALTADHARLLRRYVDRVVLVFDTDAAGLRAARRAGEPLLQAGLDVRVAGLEGAKDPDELLRLKGPEAVVAACAAGTPLVEFCLRSSLSASRDDPAGRAAALRDVFPLLVRFASSSEADASLAAAAQAAGIAPEAAREDFARFRKGDGEGLRPAPVPDPVPSAGPEPPAALVHIERSLLALLVAHPDLVAEAKAELGVPTLCRPDLQAAADLLWRAPGGAAMLVEDDGSEAFKIGDAVLSAVGQGSVPQLVPAAESLKELLTRRQELLLEREVASRTLALRQAAGDKLASAALLKELQAFKAAIESLRNERR